MVRLQIARRSVTIGIAVCLLTGCAGSHAHHNAAPSGPAPATATAHATKTGPPVLANGAVFHVPTLLGDLPPQLAVKVGSTFTLVFPQDAFPQAGPGMSLGPLTVDYGTDGDLSLLSSSGSTFVFKALHPIYEEVRYGYLNATNNGERDYIAFEADVQVEP